ncbi:hypothetical protein [Tautonia plasticadhaerens]|uniref:Uncharacterized protein n=1 Tax=Tautonia plasticadhaerens TaxID=2527974 RepID=A0A518H7R9_9BACT|nr:hypothetical protein [Tautonia plasticadhaerens]QDV36919.1 hypothetical protein ElP_48490 [Tautonia plasticadhaerens]
MSAQNGYEQFINDDEGYLRWLGEHPHGLVVNSHRAPTSSYLILHRASCEHINIPERTNWTTTGYIKTCSTDLAALAEWGGRATGGALIPCGACKPPMTPGLEPPSRHPAVAVTPASAPIGAPKPPIVPPPPEGRRSLPPEISTGCPELDRAWASYATMILDRSQILISDTDDDLTWHAFLAHSLDMQGFRAAEFAGIDPLTRVAPEFVPLKARGIGVPELASLWDVPDIRQHLLSGVGGLPLEATLGVLRDHGGAVGSSLAEAFDHFPWRKFHWSARALLQNSSALKPFDHSFRRWLAHECDDLGVSQFPPGDFRRGVTQAGAVLPLERALRMRLERTFYMVGPAMSAYMLCDWQLWLWREGRTAVFANFKLDSFHEAFVKKFGRGVIPADEAGFARWWLGLFPELPPRLANECIWLAVEGKQVNPW